MPKICIETQSSTMVPSTPHLQRALRFPQRLLSLSCAMCARTCAVSAWSALGLRLLRFPRSKHFSTEMRIASDQFHCGPRVVELAYAMDPRGITTPKLRPSSAWTC
jgi:hypothetical protein